MELHRKIVPTVNAASSASVEKMLGHFLEFMDLSSDRKRLESYFCKPSTANVSSGGVFPPPGAEAPKSISGKSAEKRRKTSNCATAGPPLLSRSRGRHSAENSGANIGALGTTTLFRGDCQRATPGERKIPRPRVAENPYTATGGTSTSNVSAAVASTPPAINVSGDDAGVELRIGDIDVEAQKAIMADIERRKAEDRRGRRECEPLDQAPGGSARRESETSGGVLPKPAAGKGKGDEAPGSSAKERAAASGPDKSRSAGLTVGVKARAKTAPKKPEGGSDGQQVFSVDDESAGAFCPMDIRDFFSKRG